MTREENKDPECVVTEALNAVLRGIANYPGSSRTALTRMLRLLTEIREGRATSGHLDALSALSENLAGDAKQCIGTPLGFLIKTRHDEFDRHIRDRNCAAHTCFRHRPAPCREACPAHIDIPSFIALIGHGHYDEATQEILKDMPFPWACGLICPHPCEDACVRGQMDQPIDIRLMKAYTAGMSMARGGYPRLPAAVKKHDRVAVVGAGPSGLSASYFLALRGYEVTVFEKQPLAGGMLRYGIPAYRLPRQILDAEISAIADLGVRIRTGICFGRDATLESLRGEGFDAFYLATGLGLSRRLNVPGEELEGVIGGIDLLRDAAMGAPPKLGKRIIVIGGGNVAVDVARTARRLGGEEITMVCLEAMEEMPAWRHEIQETLEEGIRIENSWGPRRLMGKNGRFRAVELMRCTAVFDEKRRFHPVYDECRLTVLDADTIILAVGQASDSAYANELRLNLGPGGTIKADLVTGETNIPGVFAGGDGVHGPRIAIDAIAAGKRCADSIDSFLRGEKIPAPPPSHADGREVDFLPLGAAEKASIKRPETVRLPPSERVDNFRMVESGLTHDDALNEAKRCLRCDRCRGDGLCQYVCAEVGANALKLTQTGAGDRLAFFDFENTHEKCIGCGSCAAACPHGNIEMRDEGGKRKVSFCGTVLAELPVEVCRNCGIPFASRRHMELVRSSSDRPVGVELERTLCPGCARKISAERMIGNPSFF